MPASTETTGGGGVAWCTSGRRFESEVPLAASVAIGSIVELRCADGRTFLGQVTGATVAVDANRVRVQVASGRIEAELVAGSLEPAGVDTVFDKAMIDPAPAEAVQDWRQRALGPPAGTFTLGTDRSSPTVAARLAGRGFARHTFLCGQSGAGKTYTLGLLLEELLLHTDLRIIVLDPNSDYVHLGQLSGEADDRLAQRAAEVSSRVCVFRSGDAPYRLRVRFGRMPLDIQALVLALDPVADPEEFHALSRATETIDGHEYSLGTLRRGLDLTDGSQRALALRIDNLGASSWDVWANEHESPLLDQLPADWRAAVMDLGSLTSTAEQSVIAASVLSALWLQRRSRNPVLVVIDEAHNICPQHPASHTQALATTQAINIAAEGRKFGLYLMLASQRPQKLHENVLSQCENLLLMRVNSRSDLAHLATIFSHVPEPMIAQAADFQLGEGLAAGRISPVPVVFRSGPRRSPEGGGDVPTSVWVPEPPTATA